VIPADHWWVTQALVAWVLVAVVSPVTALTISLVYDRLSGSAED
jgi:hypothetical protein